METAATRTSAVTGASDDATVLLAAVRRFPLLGRPRPACPALPERVQEVADAAETAKQRGPDGLAEAAHALNKAALVASDCGLPDLARDLCWQHINLYRQVDRRLTVTEARYMLEPVVNLARLQIRADDGQPALELLESMYKAVITNSDLDVNGQLVPLIDLTGTRQQHHKLREWVWIQLLTDGIRALALAGRWDDAAELAKTHNGIGLHLMEGRQSAIIAACVRADLHSGRVLLEKSTPTQPWEQQVASCLHVVCTDPGDAMFAGKAAAMVMRFRNQQPRPGYAVYRARYGLTVTTLASAVDPDAATHVLNQTAAKAIQADDGYAARDIIGFRSGVVTLDGAQRQALSELVIDSGLGARTLPAELHESLVNSIETAKAALAASL